MPIFIVNTPTGEQVEVESDSADNAINAVRVAKREATQARLDQFDPGPRPSLEEFIAAQPTKRGFGRAVSRGFGRGFSRMGSMFTDILPALAGSAVGADEYARQQMEEAAAKEIELQRTNRPQFPSFKDVQGPGDILPFIGETLGEQGANIISTIGTGGVGSFAGRTVARRAAQKQLDELIAAQVARKTAEARAKALPTSIPIRQQAAEAAVARRAPSFLGAAGSAGAGTGALAGAYAGSFGLSAPEIFQNIYQNTGELAPAAAIVGGGLAGALDSILPMQVLKAFKSSPKSFQAEVIKKIGERKQLNPMIADLAGKTALGIGKGVATEAATEAAQEAISIAAENFVREGEAVWGSEEFDRILESAVRGGIAGGGFGIAPGLSEALRTRAIESEEFARRAPPSPPETPVGTPDEGTVSPIDTSPLPERSALSGEPLAVPAGTGVGLGPEEIQVGLNREVAEEVRRQKPFTEEEREAYRGLGTPEQERIEAERTAIEDIAKETPEAVADVVTSPPSTFTFTQPPEDKNALYTPEARMRKDGIEYSATGDGVSAFFDDFQPSAGTLSIQGVLASDVKTSFSPESIPTITLIAKSDKFGPTKVSIDKDYIEIDGGGNFVRISKKDRNKERVVRSAIGNAAVDKFLAGDDVTKIATAIIGRDLGNSFREVQDAFKKHYSSPTETVTPAPVEAPKVITPEELKKFGFSKDSLVMKTLSGMPYATPEQVEEIRSIVSEKIKNPNQRQKSKEFLQFLGAPESKVSPPIPLALSKEELIPAIEQDKNAYAAIERLAGKKAALDQLAGDQYVGAKGLLQEEVLPFSGPEQQKKYQDYVSPEDRRYVQNRITGLKAAEKRQEYRTKQEMEQTQLQEMPQEIEEATGAEGALEQIAVPEIEQVLKSEMGRNTELAKFLQYRGEALTAGPGRKEALSRYRGILKKYPELKELGYMETPAAEQGVSSPEAFKREVKKFLGREPETADIRVTTTPSAAKMKGVPKRAVAQAELGGKKATFFTKRIPSGKEVSVFMHEVGTHVGMKNLVGETNYKYLIDKVIEWAADPKKELKNEIARAAVQKIPSTTEESMVDDELIAYFVSEAVERGVSPRALAKVDSPLGKFFKYIMQGIKDVLTKLGLPGYEPTTQDIIDIAYGAAQLTYDRAAKAQKKIAKKAPETPVVANMEMSGSAPTTPAQDRNATSALETPIQYANLNRTAARRFIDTIDEIIKKSNPAIRPSLEYIRDVVESLSRQARRAYVSLLSVTQLAEVIEAKSPALAATLRAINRIAAGRDVAVTNRKQAIEKFLIGARGVVSKYSPEIADKLYTFMHESSIGMVKFDIDKRIQAAKAAGDSRLEKALMDDAARVQNDPELKKLFDDFQKFEKKYPELGKLYYALRDQYKQLADEWTESLNQPELLGNAGKVINDLLKKNRIDPYFPLYRRGDFWVRYVDKDGKEGVSAFERAAEAREFVQYLRSDKATDIKEYIKPTEEQMESMMPLGQMQEVIKILKQKSAPPEILDGVYAVYLDMFSNQSVMQAFKKRKGLQGYRNDALANFADVGTRMAINIEQFKSVRKLDEVIRTAKAQAKDLPPAWADALDNTLAKREAFLKNPVQKSLLGQLGSAAGHNAYRWYILGNVSSAIINLTQLPIVVVPLLSGKYGLSETISAMNEARRLYFKGGFDNNTSIKSPFTGRNLSDLSFAGSKAELSEDLKKLYANAVQRGAIRRSVGQDLMEMRNLGVSDPESKIDYKKMQVEQSMSWMFQNAERFNREITLLAAYKLARKKGLSEEKAIDDALDLVEFAHGNAMSELGPQFFQTGVGKFIGVFKRFALNQIYLQYRLMKRVVSGADADVKKEAMKQFMGINAAAFAFAGLKGMPIYGLFNLLASMLVGMFGDEDEPFDLDEWALATFGPAGFRGPFGAITNLNIGTRTGFGDLLWRPDEKRLAELGPLMYAVEQVGGPTFSLVQNLAKGMGQISEGDWMKGLETASPSVLKSGFRSIRFATEGVVNSKGFKITEDPNFYDVIMSIAGFTPNDISDAYSRVAIMKNFERKAQERRNGLLDELWAARQSDDYEGIRDINKEIYDFNKSKLGRSNPITSETRERSYSMRKQREREAIYGASFNPKLVEAAKQEAGVRE